MRDGRKSRRWAQVYRDELVGVSRGCGTTAALVWVALLTYANHATATAFPMQITLATDLGVSRRTVRRAILDLEERGWVIRRWKRTPYGHRREYVVAVGR